MRYSNWFARSPNNPEFLKVPHGSQVEFRLYGSRCTYKGVFTHNHIAGHGIEMSVENGCWTPSLMGYMYRGDVLCWRYMLPKQKIRRRKP